MQPANHHAMAANRRNKKKIIANTQSIHKQSSSIQNEWKRALLNCTKQPVRWNARRSANRCSRNTNCTSIEFRRDFLNFSIMCIFAVCVYARHTFSQRSLSCLQCTFKRNAKLIIWSPFSLIAIRSFNYTCTPRAICIPSIVFHIHRDIKY